MNIKSQMIEVRRNIYEIFGNPKYSKPGLYELDSKLQKYLDFKNGFFIEVGANDGYAQSNTYYLEKFLNWSGILVEGIPNLYDKCKKRRRNSSVFNYALVSHDFEDTEIEMHYANLMSVIDGSLKSNENQKKHIYFGLKLQNIDNSYTLKVPTRTLESILDEFKGLPQIDFFSLDVEGYEIDVLKGLNIKKYKPKYILVEARFLDEVNKFLSPYYDMIDKMTYHDYLYMLR